MSNEIVEVDAGAQALPQTTDQMAFSLIRQGADAQAVRDWIALTKEIAAEKARNAFNEAVAMAKAEIPVVSKNAKGHNNKTYANFAAYAAAIDPVIAKYGLRYRFRTEQTNGITVVCVISHKDGHSEENSLSAPSDTSGNKNAIQAIGSTLTYLQRYTLIQAFGLAASDDDDGDKADNKTKPTITEEQQMQLRDLLLASETDERQFLSRANIENLSDILVSEFDSAMGLLRQKLARKGK